MRLHSIKNSPVVRSWLYSPAVIYIQFPSGELWEYVLYDDRLLRQLLYRYGKNVGRLVATMKKMGVEARPIAKPDK